MEFRDPTWYADDVFALLRAPPGGVVPARHAGSATDGGGWARSCMFDFTGPGRTDGGYPDERLAAGPDGWRSGERTRKTCTPISTTTSEATRHATR